ncbi:MAG: hypothetical protein PHC52_00495 [Syntrophales bacterium]|nr:hypothetical protein [Syntrophales bacterium]
MRLHFYKFIAFVVLAALCIALCIGCASVPDKVKDSLAGDVRDWRLVKRDLVQTMPEGPDRDLWLDRFAAFIVRARANVAWANKDDSFSTIKALEEERSRAEK